MKRRTLLAAAAGVVLWERSASADQTIRVIVPSITRVLAGNGRC
jgi:hypothetical protein